MKFRDNRFLLGILAVIGISFLFPEWGASQVWQGFTVLGVMLIFFMQGLSLSTGELWHGVGNWRLHLFVQFWIFIGTGILFGVAGMVVREITDSSLGNGLFYLALLPTTLSSAVAFTIAGNGNVAGSIFNTTLSNLVGVFWIPLGAILIFTNAESLPDGIVLDLLWDVGKLILIPLAVGQLIQPLFHDRTIYHRARPHFKTINNGVILLIVWITFSESFLSDHWSAVGRDELGLLAGVVLLIAIVIHALVFISGRYCLSEGSDQISGFFCGTQKTLAAGVPIAALIFGNEVMGGAVHLGELILPLMIYHSTQLLFGSVFLKLSRRKY